MSELGDLLERALDPRYTCVRAHVCATLHLEPHRRFVERSGGGIAMAMSGDPGAPPPTTSEAVREIWLHTDGRYRVEQGAAGYAEFGDRSSRLILRPDLPAMRVDQNPNASGFDRTPLEPAALVSLYTFTVVGDEVVAGREGVHVHGDLRNEVAAHRFPLLGIHHPVTPTAELVFDRETGVLLRSIALDGDGEYVATVEIEEIAFDDDVDDADFVLPADVPVLSEAEFLLGELVADGVDVSGIDPSDLDAVRRARMDHLRSKHGFGVADRRARYQPTGPPPDDEDAARAAITHAFEHLADRNDEGWPDNIQGGENLGQSLDRAADRFAGQTRIEVEDVIFLDHQHAVVWFQAIAEGGPRVGQEGRALLLDGAWKVARETVGALLALAGVHIPPPVG